MSLRIINKTMWSGRDLRKFARAGLIAEGMDPDKYTVEFVPYKGGCYGWGWYHRNRMKLCLPTRFAKDKDIGARWVNARVLKIKGQVEVEVESLPIGWIQSLAHTLVHEVAHNRGLSHREMDCKRREKETVWAEGLTIGRATVKAKPSPTDRVKAREVHVRSKVEEIEAKIEAESKRHTKATKALRTRLKSWQAKARYYDRKAAHRIG